MKAARHQSWPSFISSVNTRTSRSAVWRKVRKIAGKFSPNPPPILKVNGQCMAGAAEVINVLAEHFAKISCKSESSPEYQYRYREEVKVLDFRATRSESYNLPFTEREFDSAIASCNDTSPGKACIAKH